MYRNLKGGIGRYMRLYEVLHRMEKIITRIRNRAGEDDYGSEQYQPVLGKHMRCLQEESDGIPCCHIFTTIKFEMITSFSDSLVNKRWIKEVSKKKKLPNTANASDKSL
ncbi:hypothetical protein M0R45_009339 [Rubus argutus]|uniref:Uncharacterized protein n=1 Tax=Rubus argutus TaxID=59490 RepID=A0AAW1Y6Q9_RUBAR